MAILSLAIELILADPCSCPFSGSAGQPTDWNCPTGDSCGEALGKGHMGRGGLEMILLKTRPPQPCQVVAPASQCKREGSVLHSFHFMRVIHIPVCAQSLRLTQKVYFESPAKAQYPEYKTCPGPSGRGTQSVQPPNHAEGEAQRRGRLHSRAQGASAGRSTYTHYLAHYLAHYL